MADQDVAYGASAAYTITLASLATSSSLVAGRESTAVSNTTNLYLDYLIGGRITVGTTPTINTTIEVWAYGSLNDTPTYVDSFTGSDSARSVTTAPTKAVQLALIAILQVDATTSNRVFWFGPVSLVGAFNRLTVGGLFVPKNHGIWVVHNSVAALHATGGNHVINYTPVYMTVT